MPEKWPDIKGRERNDTGTYREPWTQKPSFLNHFQESQSVIHEPYSTELFYSILTDLSKCFYTTCPHSYTDGSYVKCLSVPFIHFHTLLAVPLWINLEFSVLLNFHFNSWLQGSDGPANFKLRDDLLCRLSRVILAVFVALSAFHCGSGSIFIQSQISQ